MWTKPPTLSFTPATGSSLQVHMVTDPSDNIDKYTRYTLWEWEEIWDIGRKIEIIKASDHNDAAAGMETDPKGIGHYFFTT